MREKKIIIDPIRIVEEQILYGSIEAGEWCERDAEVLERAAKLIRRWGIIYNRAAERPDHARKGMNRCPAR